MVEFNELVFRQLADSIAEGVYFLDEGGLVTYWNKAAERITGYSKEEVLGRKCSDDLLRHTDELGRELCLEGCHMRLAMSECEPQEADIFLHHKDGHRVPILVHASPLLGAEGKAIGAIEVFSDRSDRARLLAELEVLKKEALVDPLTGLGNRRFAEMNIASALRDIEAEGAAFGLLILDIDHFKKVNDEFGHMVGDRVLRMVAWTLANAVRRNDAAARWGGEEFVVLCPGIRPELLAEVAERVRALVERSWIGLGEGRKAAATVSIGGAMARRGDTLESLVGRADERLYSCKESGRNRAEVGD
jgi:diguanylate cyclase (GGDEF)-like protein/PAS domain S-box-containing protein